MSTLPSLLTPTHTAYQTALRRPQHTQAQILHTILRSNQHSQFGQQHHFAHIHNPEDYAQRVPELVGEHGAVGVIGGSGVEDAAARAEGMTYNRFIQGLGLAGVEVDRRMLAELAVNEPTAFTALVEVARKALPADVNAPRA